MSVFRTKKVKNFTVMSNNHLKQPDLSFKARGILSTILAYPDDWEFSIEGLAKMASDGIKSTRSGVNELIEKGFIVRRQERSENGLYMKIIYDVYEVPFSFENAEKENISSSTDISSCTGKTYNNENAVNGAFDNFSAPKDSEDFSVLQTVRITSEKISTNEAADDLNISYNTDMPKCQSDKLRNVSVSENGYTDKITDFAAKLTSLCEEFYKFCGNTFSLPQVPFRQADKCRQLNTIIPNTDYNINQSIYQSDRARIDRSTDTTHKVSVDKEYPTAKDYERYKNMIKENVEYDSLASPNTTGKEYLDEIIDIMADVVTFNEQPIRINGYNVSAEVVKNRFLKIDEFEMSYILESIEKHSDKIYNIRSYLITTIYNAKSTMNHYYGAMVRYDMAHPKERVCYV